MTLTQDQIMYFLVNASPFKLLDIATSILQVHRSQDIEGDNVSCNLDPKVKGQKKYFLKCIS